MPHWEALGKEIGVFTTSDYTFGADALRLAAFVPQGLRRICEFGTGCGVVALQLCQNARTAGRELPQITALDIQPDATELAARSVVHSGLQEHITVLTADWRTAPLLPSSFDAVVCNPPYFPSAVGGVNTNEARRIARHEDSPAALDELCTAAARMLKHGGRFFLCHRPERLADLMTALRTAGLEPKRLCLVQHDTNSSPYLLLCEARKGGRVGVSFDPTIAE
ncbi:MAG: methyltransferase domain-containing protein [Ruminococcaceae bacterium]|nr:methyltransferase domain-containing protein [Oscillospiraceae bacterium]